MRMAAQSDFFHVGFSSGIRVRTLRHATKVPQGSTATTKRARVSTWRPWVAAPRLTRIAGAAPSLAGKCPGR